MGEFFAGVSGPCRRGRCGYCGCGGGWGFEFLAVEKGAAVRYWEDVEAERGGH